MDVQDQAPWPKRSVLIVDDDALILKLAVRAVQRIGFEVHAVSNLLEAINCLTLHRDIGLVISDVEMPRGSGLDLLDTMKRDSRWSCIPFALMTGGPIYHLPAGLFVLPKPFLPLQICCVVIAHMGGTCPAGLRDGERLADERVSRTTLRYIDPIANPCDPLSCNIFVGAGIA